MLSLKSDKSKLFEYLLLFFILLTLSDQNAAENECQKDLSKSVQELLDSFSGINSGLIGRGLALKWVQEHGFGVLCCLKIEAKFKMDENFKKMHKNFCQQLANGKSVDETSLQNIEKTATNLMDKTDFKQIISQNIPKNSFLDGKTQKKVAKLMEHFIMGIDKFMAFLKAKNASGYQHKDGNYANVLLRRRRRYNEVRERRLKKNGCGFLMMGVLASIACGAFYAPFWNQKWAIPALILCVVYFLSCLIELFIFCR
ncbi:hypothetical protein GPALN_016299 [Globodera pallida]|nr:hypothetical protein GPALN_016299 [Globodera pallida]